MSLMKNSRKCGQMFFVFLLMLWFSSSGLMAQNLNINVKEVPLVKVLDQIKKQTGYRFTYIQALDVKNMLVDAKADNQNPEAFFQSFFPKYGISYKIMDNLVALTPNTLLSMQEVEISGVVSDPAGEPLAGTVIQNITFGENVVADIDGRYSIMAREGDELIFTMIGFKTVKNGVGKSNVMNVVMTEDVEVLNDVVVTGYQTISKERSAGSYAVITTDKIEEKLQPNIMSRLEGVVSGMQMYKGKPVIRGTSTIYADQSPLYVVDGVPFEGDIEMINPNDIVNVSVLKDATAASIYGARSTNGVIVITTRSGKEGKCHVSYNGTVSMQGLPDHDYLNFMSTEDFVDFQKYTFEVGGGQEFTLGQRRELNAVHRLMLEHGAGQISDAELAAGLDRYKNMDRLDQVKSYLNKVSFEHQHNLSFNGGSDFYRYAFSVNYTGSDSYDKGQYNDRIGFNLKNNFKFTKWLHADVGLMGNVIKNSSKNGFSIYQSYLGQDYKASYYRLADENGNPVKWENWKSREEVERLNGLGLYDESYYPLQERDLVENSTRSHYFAFNLGLKFNIIEGLNIDLRYQTELGASFYKTVWNKDSYKVRKMINDASVVKDGEITRYVPEGGQDYEDTRSQNSYTLRAQINYDKVFKEKHHLTVLAGAERRKVSSEGNSLYRYGYDDMNLSYGYLKDEEMMRGQGIRGAQDIYGKFVLSETPVISSQDDRYVSFYANASYVYNQRLNLSASIRMDQSNLFGTDPKYQYKPLWSAGASYQVFKDGDVSWINRLGVRATYGINGNVYRKSGPYIIAKVGTRPDRVTSDKYSYIVSPPNSSLRWEKTRSLNLGVNFSFLNNRLGGSVDFYNKKTTDMIGGRESDPTTGWDHLTINYASMRNTGVEIVLESTNIDSPSFRWNTSVMFSYNNNKIKDLESSGSSAFYYYGRPMAVKDKPYNALYSVRYAGLDEKGNPRAYLKNGEIVNSTTSLAVEDLVYSGTLEPPYTASMNNTLSFKGFDLSFMFLYYGGHVMRDVMAGMDYTQSPSVNADRLNANMFGSPWSKDDLYTLPAFKNSVGWMVQDVYRAADIHIQRGDYIKLKDISLSYSFPEKWIRKVCMQQLRLTFQAQNVWTWTANRNHLDPEVWTGSDVLPSRGVKIPTSYVIGLNINF